MPVTSAPAAYLSRTPADPPDDTGGQWQYTAADGEVNRLTVTATSQALVFADQGARIKVLAVGMAASLCGAMDTGGTVGRVECRTPETLPALQFLSAFLSDGDDVATVTTLAGNLSGGSGDDTLTLEGRGLGCLLGGTGNDTLTGSLLTGGPGADRLVARGRGSWAIYTDHEAPVSVDLRRRAGQGSPGEGDSISGVDSVQGGFGRDRLVGSASANQLDGGFGADTLVGEAGADRLTGGPDGDRVYGGPGRDKLIGDEGSDFVAARDGQQDIVDCGLGRDTAIVDRLDRVRGCERVLRP